MPAPHPQRVGHTNISIFHAGNLGLAAQEPLHEKLKEKFKVLSGAKIWSIAWWYRVYTF